MNYSIEKELLLARLHYLEAMKNKPGVPDVSPIVIEKVKEQIVTGKIETYLRVESLFNYLVEKQPDNAEKAEKMAAELLAFIDQ